MKNSSGSLKNNNKEVATIVDKIKNFFRIPKDRAISMPDIYHQIQSALYETSDAWLVDIYLDNQDMYAILADKGKLYKATVDFDGQNTATLSEDWVEVMQEYAPVSKALKIKSTDGGSYRWFLIAGTSILDRNAEIDSMKLFDNLAKRCEESKSYPFLTFFHLDRAFQMGVCDFLARDGVVLIASGTFEKGNPLAEAMIRSYEQNPEYWGASIGFYPVEVNMVEVSKDVKIPVYDDGIFREISILPEEYACDLMTGLQAVKERNIMNERVKEALEKLAGGDESLLSDFISKVDDVNRTVEEENLIHREAAEGEASEQEQSEPEAEAGAETQPTPDEKEEEEQEEEQMPELILDEKAMQLIAGMVVESETIRKLTQDNLMLVTKTEAMQKEINDLHGALIRMEKETNAQFEQFQRSDDEKQREWEADLSERVVNKVRVSYRPTKAEGETDKSVSMADIASSTVSNIK